MSEGNVDLTSEVQASESLHLVEHERTLRGILKVGAVVLTVMMVIAPFSTLGWRQGLLDYGPGVVLHLAHLFWLRRDNVSIVAVSHCLTYFVWVTGILAFSVGGLGPPAALVYPPLVVMAGLVWSGRAALGMAALVSAAGAALAALQMQHVLTATEAPLTPWRMWVVMTACVVVTAALMRFALGVLERSNVDRLHNERRYADLVRSAPDAMVFVDRDLSVQAGNPALERLLERTSPEIIGKKLSELGLFARTAQVQLEASMEHTFEDGRPRLLELTALPDGGAERPLEVSMHRAALQSSSLHLNLRDISERRQSAELQEELRKSQRLESLGRLAGGVAHDFNNLLTVILGSVELQQMKHPSEEGKAIKEAATRAVSLTRQLLAFGRRQVLQAESVELNRAFADARPLLDRLLNEEIRLEIQGSTGPCYAIVDRAQLDQVLINLVVNARDAMPRGGTISMQCGRGYVPSSVVDPARAQGDTDNVWIAVSDTGVGLASDVRDRIFEPFFTTKAAGLGTGLGLATVHGIVAQSGGAIAVESEVGRGTRFYVTLPEGKAPPPVAARRPVAAIASKGARVLVVEDEPALRAVVKAMLESGGYNVTAAPSPLQALELLAAAQPHFELLVTDVVMYGMSGPELARNACAKQPELRVLFTSGHADELVEARGVLRTDVQFVAKPFMSDVLLRRVAEVLASSRAPAQRTETGT